MSNTSDLIFKKEILERVNIQETKEKVLEIGPLESVFPCSESRIMDFLVTMKEYDYSISDISRYSGVGFKTTLGVIKNLESQNVILNNRNVGRAKMYQPNPDSIQAKSFRKLALDIATDRTIQATNN